MMRNQFVLVAVLALLCLCNAKAWAQPTISSQPASATVTAPNSATFTIVGTYATIQWQVSTDSGSSWTDIPNAESSSFDTGATSTFDHGKQYRAVLTDGAELTSNVATLSVDATSYGHVWQLALNGSDATLVTIRLRAPTTALAFTLTAFSTAAGAGTDEVLLFQEDGTPISTPLGSALALTSDDGSIMVRIAGGSAPSAYVFSYTYLVASNPVSDTMALQTYASSCSLDALAPTEFGFTRAPRLATVTMTWSTDYLLDVVVTVPYEKDEAIVMIDMVDFDAYTGNIRNRSADSCSNRPSISQSVPFGELFHSAATATSPGALDGTYDAYPDLVSTGWSVTALSCSSIQYTRSFALSELTDCNGVTRTTDTESSGLVDTIKYSGTLFINTLQPEDGDWNNDQRDEQFGYTKFTQQFPFELTIETMYESLVRVSTEDQDRIHVGVRRMTLVGNNLNVELETRVVGTGVVNATVNSAFGGSMVLDGTPPSACTGNSATDVCVQVWQFVAASWQDAYNGQYNFSWTYNDLPVYTVTVPIDISAHISNTDAVVGRIGDMQLRVYNSLGAADAATVGANRPSTYGWNVNERVYLRGDVMLNQRDLDRFNARFVDLWVCYPPLGYTVSLVNGGCADPNIPDANRVRLVDSNVVSSSLSAAPFLTSQDTYQKGSSSLSVGASFNAFPLTINDRVYTVHARAQITTADGRKRFVTKLLEATPSDMSPAATISLVFAGSESIRNNDANVAHHDEHAVVSNKGDYSSMAISISMTLVGVALVMVAAVVAAVGVLIYRRDKKPMIGSINLDEIASSSSPSSIDGIVVMDDDQL